MNKEDAANKLLEIYSKLSEIEKHLSELDEYILETIDVKDDLLINKVDAIKVKNNRLKGEIIGITIPKINLNN